ncbi:MAG: imidazolonepropionase [Thermoplasmata archaeon]|jgi:imidazolonepropionase
MIVADLLVTGIGELATLAQGPVPRIGERMEELGLRHDAAFAVRDGRFAWIGADRAVARAVRLRRGGVRVDAGGGTIVPGFVDAHTHLLYGGDRVAELALKIRGVPYAEIARRGGGIYSSVRATRRASDPGLLASAEDRMRRMALAGTTSFEVKSGYALSHAGELRLLRLIPRLARRTGFEIVATYLGAHAVPPEFRGRADAYVDQIVRRTLPVIAQERLAAFCDVFCEPGFFSVPQSERILRTALGLGLGIKIHADEFVLSGGARLAARLGARSAEHLLEDGRPEFAALARAGVTAVLLPATPFASLTARASPGRGLVDAGVAVAIGSDCSPNSWIEAMPIVLAHAVYGARLSPREAITAATVNAAYASGLADRAGSIAVGRAADFGLFALGSPDRIPYRIGSIPVAVYRQGIRILPG